MKNPGKQFEDDFKKSVPDHIHYKRFNDGTANFSGGSNENVRFQQKNMCDCQMFRSPCLFYLELKSFKGKSIPITNIKKGPKDRKIYEMVVTALFKNIYTGYILNFRDIEKTYYLPAYQVLYFIESGDRKSIPLNFCEQEGILIDQTLKKTHYHYDIDKLLDNIRYYKIKNLGGLDED